MSARSRRTGPKSLKRATATTPVRKTFRIYAEGIATEPDYIDAIKRLPEFAESIAIDLVVERAGATPMTLVEAARADKRNGSLDIDQYWCVFDVESPRPHPYLERARQVAVNHGIQLAVSNPCFEFWLVLHLENHTAYLTTADAVSLRKRLDQSGGKHLDAARYMGRRNDAIRRARWLRIKHRNDGTSFPEDNPSSSFDEFLTQVAAALEAAPEVSGRSRRGR